MTSGTLSVSGGATIAGASTLVGDVTIGSSLVLTSTTSNLGTVAVDILASDAGYTGTVMKVRASRGSSTGFKLIEAQNGGATAVFSVRGDGAVTLAGTLAVGGASTVGGDLFVTGQSILSGGMTLSSGLTLSSGSLRVGVVTR